MLKQILAIFALTGVLAAQDKAPAAKPAAPTVKPAGTSTASPVDNVIQLLKEGISEPLIIKTLQRENKPVNLTTADMVKLTKAGASENIISVMMDPSASVKPAAGAATSAVTPPKAELAATPSGEETSFPPSMGGTPAGPHKRRLAVKPFDYSTVRTWVNYWFQSDVNIGDGIRAMLTARLAQSKNITLLERAKVDDALKEQDFGATNRVAQGTKAKIGKVTGADAILYGDITIFGRDDSKKRNGVATNLPGPFGALGNVHKEEKAVVAIALRIIDAETLEVVETGEARGESKRTSNDWGALMAGKGKGGAVNSDMTSSNFEQTIIGEATSDAVSKVVAWLEQKIPQIPEKARTVEGRVAVISGNQMTLNIGETDGVLAGDRFEIDQITDVVLDPETKQEIDKVTVKVGEFVVHHVRPKTATGEYGGKPVSQAYAQTGKGYAARLMPR
ncbi:MAG TPA: CsgG/HfaB family protein [Candidatus Acidoferrales bacterium]|nr:CsgG/HfaB family protein [Candidatus Acidoferrales bacterium]